MLTALSMRNFKSWPAIEEMRLAPVTGLFGANSSGKTSVLQTLLLLQQTVESSDRTQVLNFGDERSLVSLGTFRDVVIDHDTTRSVELALHWQLSKALHIPDVESEAGRFLVEGNDLGFSVEVSGEPRNGLVVNHMTYDVVGNRFGMRRQPGMKYELTAEVPHENFRFKRSPGRVWPVPPPVKCYGFPDQVRTYYQNAGFLADLELEFQRLFARLFYLGPLREYPQRQYTWAGGAPADVGWRGERVVEALLASRARGRTNSRGYKKKHITVEEHVAQWLYELGLIHSFAVETIDPNANLYRVVVRKTRASAPVLLTDVGFGVSQVLPALTLLAYVPEQSIVILEQPEIHLHPAVQAGLADVIIEAVHVRRVQVIVESHSEHLLTRLQRRVAERRLPADDIALYFCAMQDRTSTLEQLEMDLFGNIVNWPEEFFADRVEERAAMMEAVAQRRIEAMA